jgi:hypothetical protein
MKGDVLIKQLIRRRREPVRDYGNTKRPSMRFGWT